MRIIIDLLKWFMNGTWAWLTFKPNSRPRRVAKRIILRFIEIIEARPCLKQRIVSKVYRLGLYPISRKFFHRIAEKNISIQTENSMIYTQNFTLIDECITPWTHQMLLRLKASRAEINRETK